MRLKLLLAISGLVGILCGLGSSYPVALSALPSSLAWGIAGLVIGWFAKNKTEIIWSGVVYGIFLAITFLLYRFGGTADKILPYSVLIVLFSIFSALAGIITVFLGTKARAVITRKTD